MRPREETAACARRSAPTDSPAPLLGGRGGWRRDEDDARGSGGKKKREGVSGISGVGPYKYFGSSGRGGNGSWLFAEGIGGFCWVDERFLALATIRGSTAGRAARWQLALAPPEPRAPEASIHPSIHHTHAHATPDRIRGFSFLAFYLERDRE
jgi:hypothetical protein